MSRRLVLNEDSIRMQDMMVSLHGICLAFDTFRSYELTVESASF